MRAYILATLCGVPACGGGVEVPAKVTLHTVCEAGRQPVGARILVRGEFDGFLTYETPSRTIRLTTHELCNSRGAGTVFAELASTNDREQFRNTRPELREQGAHGDMVTLSVLRRLADPVLTNLANGALKARMPSSKRRGPTVGLLHTSRHLDGLLPALLPGLSCPPTTRPKARMRQRRGTLWPRSSRLER